MFEGRVTDSSGRSSPAWTVSASCRSGATLRGEAQRAARYRELIEGGFPDGVAADDGVALHYVGTELHEIVTCRPAPLLSRTREGEEKLPARELG